jgi:hypothetical protein
MANDESNDESNDELYNDFISEVQRNVFLRVGQTLINEFEPKSNIYIKTYEESKFEYLAKIDNKLDALFYKQEKILEQINVLTLENKNTLDNITVYEEQLHCKNIFTMIKIYSKREYLQMQLDNDKTKYITTFGIITKLHEDILEIDEQIKNTKLLKQCK